MRCAGLLGVLVAAIASAGAPEDLETATQLLRGVQEEQAIAVLTRALDRGDATPAQRCELYLLLAIARFNLRDAEGARLGFRRALEANPDAVLPKLAPPKAKGLFDEEQVTARSRATAPKAEPAPQQPAAAPPAAVTVTAPTPETKTPVRRWVGLVAAVAGVGAGIAGGVLVAQSGSDRARAAGLTEARQAYDAFNAAASLRQTGFIVLTSGAVIALLAAALALWP